MTDPTHLYEADKVRIRNEAKVHAAMAEPDWVNRSHQEWREYWEARAPRRTGQTRQEYLKSMQDFWARRAFVAEGREVKMGRELEKLQKRIGRQRKANREQHRIIKELREKLGEQ